MKILVLNCGSSSVKYKLFEMVNNEVLASGVVEKIGMKGSFLKHTKQNGEKVMLEGEILEQRSAIEYVLGVLISKNHGCISALEDIDAVGHRVVHGGEKFNKSVLITDEVISKIEECIDIAPLHNPPNLYGIQGINDLLPDVPQVAVFDTAFHQTMPERAYMYAIPYQLYTKYGVRRYGFHGTSHRYVSHRACEFLNLDYENTKMITVHIGNGASVAAIKNGKSIDTSMGFTPLEGLIMGTRSGDIDLGAAIYLMDKEMIGSQAVSTLFNKYSGVLGVSGVSSDMRDVEDAAQKGNLRAQLALEMYNYRLRKYIGSYMAALDGADMIIFTGGVGENSPETREQICAGFEYAGLIFDYNANDSVRGKEKLLSKPESKVKVVVIPTDEEFLIASDTMEIIDNRQ
ncbi:MAG: acetate kinase [Paludibacter sp.]|nr:acetate kinase [Paludibacter sp.]